MKISKIDIQYYHKDNLGDVPDGLAHIKSLPYLSIVQATEGSYDFGFSPESREKLPPGGAFIAPAHTMQYITHHYDTGTGRMRAHWLFLDAVINDEYSLDDCFDFPLKWPEDKQDVLESCLNNIGEGCPLALQMSSIYMIINILISIGKEKNCFGGPIGEVRRYIEKNYRENFTITELAEICHMSQATFFREFKRETGTTPMQYRLKCRLNRAAFLLETTDANITQAALESGFCDQPYFTKQFVHVFGVSPTEYRNR